MKPILMLAVTCLAGLTAANSEPFSFVALGDTTYAIPADNPLYRQMIDAINAAEPAFSIHVGDTKGWGDCGRAFQQSQRGFFDSFAAPVFYAPGNNEWADCWKANRNSADPTEILALMRDVFFGEPLSMGARRMPMVRQSDEQEAFPEFAENARWQHGGATFATLNMVGERNNQELRVERYWREFARREQANVAWVEATFAAARAAGHRATVLAFHSNPFDERLRYDGGPFEPVLRAIVAEADAFDGEVLVVHGHHHELVIDRPVTELDLDTPAVRHPNITRLQVYGWPDMKAVRVSVDTSKPWVFGFEPVYASRSVSSNSDADLAEPGRPVIGRGSSIEVDGAASADEWTDAWALDIPIGDGRTATVRVKHDGDALLFAFEGLSDSPFLVPEVLLDLDNDKTADWGTDDWWFHASFTDCAKRGGYDDWSTCVPEASSWQANNLAEGEDGGIVSPGVFEICVPFESLGRPLADGAVIGIAFNLTDTDAVRHLWPNGARLEDPSSWGEAVVRGLE